MLVCSDIITVCNSYVIYATKTENDRDLENHETSQKSPQIIHCWKEKESARIYNIYEDI